MKHLNNRIKAANVEKLKANVNGWTGDGVKVWLVTQDVSAGPCRSGGV